MPILYYLLQIFQEKSNVAFVFVLYFGSLLKSETFILNQKLDAHLTEKNTKNSIVQFTQPLKGVDMTLWCCIRARLHRCRTST